MPTISAICIYSGRLPQFLESLASFIAQDYEDRELLVINCCVKQTLAFDHAKIKVYNLKENVLPVRAKNGAMQYARGEYIIAWDELSVALPNFLTQIAAAVQGREWAWLNSELCLDTAGNMKVTQGSEFSFVFKKSVMAKTGPYPPGIRGASDRNLMAKIVALHPGEPTVVHPENINLIRLGTPEERERVMPDAKVGMVKLQPNLSKDYAALAEIARTGRREHRLCVVSLGRFGDIIAILPVLKEIHDLYETPHLMVSAKFAELLEGVSYVKPFVTNLDQAELGSALTIAKSAFQIVLVGGCWGKGWHQVIRTPSYNRDEWGNLGLLHRFHEQDLRPVFDRRDMEREQALLDLIRGEDKRPMLLVNVSSGISSPCPECAALLPEIQQVWGEMYHVVDLTKIRAHRLYDFLLTFESAAALISIDTSFLHLCSATSIPVVAITSTTGKSLNADGTPWGATLVRCGNGVNHISYTKVFDDNRKELHESIAAALERPNLPVKVRPSPPLGYKPTARRVFHLVDRFEDTDRKTLERKMKSWATWDDLYVTGQMIPAHCWSYPRNAKDVLGESKSAPFLKDLLAHGVKQCGDDDILLWTNDDNLIHPDLPEYLKFHLSVYGPCSIFRTEIRGLIPSLKLTPEQFGKTSKESHVGRDGFAFTKRWLVEHWDELPDWALSYRMWDIHAALIIRQFYGIKTTNKNVWDQILPAEAPIGYLGHIAHTSAWTINMDSPGNTHNGLLFKSWCEQHLPNLKVTPEGNLA